MGKVLGGCLIVLTVVLVGGGGVGYYMFVRPYTELAGAAVRYAEEYEQLDRAIENRDPYRPQPSQSLEPEQLERMLAVHERMRTTMAGRLAMLEERYREIERDREPGTDPSLREVMTAYRDLGELYMEAKRAQVDALNAEQLSLAEYHWIRNQTYLALGRNIAVVSAQTRQVPRGTQPVTRETEELVADYRDDVLESYMFAWFGL